MESLETLTGLGFATLIVMVLLAYLVPSVIAGARHHHQTGAILVLNLLLGWTLLGWIAALVWAFTATPGKDVAAL